MGRSQQFLHPGMGGQSYLDTFAVVGPRWTARAGTLAAGLQAATAGDWLGNLVSNGEFAAGVAGWDVFATSITRVASAADPGAPSGGGDNWCGKVANIDTSPAPLVRMTLTGVGIVSATYKGDGRGYAPSANTRVNAAAISVYDTALTTARVTVEDAWQALTLSRVATSANFLVDLRVRDAASNYTTGDIGYFDAITLYRQNTVATIAWGSPNIQITLDLAIPAAPSVVPFSAVVRYTDALNYWEVRTTPNTAGNDLEIIEVVAGVETQRAAADIDWTAGGTDQLRINVYGTTTAVEVKKSGAAGFTAACSYTTMATGAAAVDHGLMFYGTGVNRCTRWQSV